MTGRPCSPALSRNGVDALAVVDRGAGDGAGRDGLERRLGAGAEADGADLADALAAGVERLRRLGVAVVDGERDVAFLGIEIGERGEVPGAVRAGEDHQPRPAPAFRNREVAAAAAHLDPLRFHTPPTHTQPVLDAGRTMPAGAGRVRRPAQAADELLYP